MFSDVSSLRIVQIQLSPSILFHKFHRTHFVKFDEKSLLRELNGYKVLARRSDVSA